ncbi:UDP-N-acetylglucosamine 2-epimerase (non-hydrolysing) [Halorubrum aquaticum]|uniref:UDP-N-acetylglucosamine 2-epimerase (Non-hydrolysing) n=1 Tax=Halorubrum aquaticum TaxID=387340 RepID=A0A1I3ADK7_9EURY|nr:UDP-N-acetylglucosamine 2-epimerase (non-hydrolyzing) [Halorubrum aquaticum]SFH48167.1 UDP-N-acetylglucosamine 2-epimerase (non-hydrolysing) [Halorubrum aquaticum]
MTDVAFVLGTRPEIIKLAPVVQACERADLEYAIVHTGQHYSDSLDSVFFDQLDLPDPDYDLAVGSGSHGKQTAEMLVGVERAVTETEPAVVLVQGDTNSVLAGALAASKMDTELGHVEAGLRSFDRGMPEETNRVLADHAADYHFAPTDRSKGYLLREGISKFRITVTGNTVVDAIERNLDIAREKSTVLADLGLDGSRFFLMTAHRAENVDDEERFEGLLAGAQRAGDAHDVDVIYPMHPRSRNRLEEFGIDLPPRVRGVEPLEYLDFLQATASADLVLTDSGGVQEEACILGVPCVTMRDNTERPETVDVGANRLSSCDPARIERSVAAMIGAGGWENPFGDGDAADRILRALPLDPEPEEVPQ